MRCRTNAEAKPHPHACSSWHRILVDDYRAARDAQTARRDYATNGIRDGAENDEFFGLREYRGSGAERKILFKDWLLGYAREEAPA